MDQNQKQNRIALLLMGSSLLLLGLFLAIWIKNVYTQEIGRLQEKSSFIFINSIRQAETEFIKKDLLAPILATLIESGDSIKMTAFSFESYDTSGISLKRKGKFDHRIAKAIVETEDIKYTGQYKLNKATQKSKTAIRKNKESFDSNGIRMETTISINMEGDQLLNEDPLENVGELVSWVFKNYTDDSLKNFSSLQIDSLLKKDLHVLVKSAPKVKDIPSDFKVIKVQDSIPHQKAILSEAFRDVETGDAYALAFDETYGFIFRKMLPQLLFSILLFSMTALSFFFIYKSLKDQQHLTSLKNDLISNISHELKTPIATVGVAIEALQNFGALDNKERTKEYLEISKQELNRLSILVDKVLNTSLFDKKEMPLNMEQIDLEVLVRKVLNTMKLQFLNKEAAIDFKVKGGAFLVEGDKIHLTSVIYNLVDNALKYSPLFPKLRIEVMEKKAAIQVSIKDNGLGIPAAYKDKIFDKFFRVPNGNEHNIKGHGLGLNYVKKVIKKHKGNISFQSIDGKGSQFFINLPKATN